MVCTSDNLKDCVNDSNNRRKKKTNIMLSIGLAASIVGMYLLSKKNNTEIGIFAGGILSILYYTYSNWDIFNDDIKLLLLGSSLCIFIVSPILLKNISSFTEIEI